MDSLFCGETSPSTAQCSCLCVVLGHMAAGHRGMVLIPLPPTRNLELTSRFGIILRTLVESSSTWFFCFFFLQLGSRVESRPWLTSFKFNPSALFLVEFLTSVLQVSVLSFVFRPASPESGFLQRPL